MVLALSQACEVLVFLICCLFPREAISGRGVEVRRVL